MVGRVFYVPRGVLEATLRSISLSSSLQHQITSLEATFLAVDKYFFIKNSQQQISYPNAMSSGIGSTLTGGIQDVAGILPLLGTEQCSIHVSSALTKGYLYAASAPMSIFGSLGVVSAGFKTLVACFSYGDIEGAKILGNMGFEPQGENLSLIMVEDASGKEENKGETKVRYVIENRMDTLIDELNIDKTRITGVSHKSATWNIKMIATTALLCALSITPYIYINLSANSLDLKRGAIWAFPILRSTGGFITATLIQLLIQQRITTISDGYLAKQLPVGDVEAAPGVDAVEKKYQMDTRTWPLLFLLFIGLLASVVGYVGCFSIVQNSASNYGPVSWLCLEVGLSLARLAIWASNPKSDDAPPLEISFELDKHEPLPTCNKDNEEIIEYKVLPLTRARDFLKSITSFVGLIKPFTSPGLSLYYTLIRKRAYKEGLFRRNRDYESWDAERHKPGERTLYITVFDHKEHTTRVYTRDNEVETFFSTKLDAPLVDVGHFILEVEIDAKIDSKSDPVCSDGDNMDSLREHHRSILEHIHHRLGAGDVTKTYAIDNSWTMKAEDTNGTIHRLREGNCEAIVEKGREEERTYELVSDYFMHSSIERQRRLLDSSRGRWIALRMEMIAKETKERLLGVGVEYRVDKQAVEKKPKKTPMEVKKMLILEEYFMELLLVWEVKEWEQLFWNKFKAFLVKIGDDRVEEKERLTREWRANCWKRLNSQRDAALKRMADVDNDGVEDKDWASRYVGEEWASCIRQFFEGVENPDGITLPELRRRIEKNDTTLSDRMQIEIEDAKFRLKRGSELGRFDQFWEDFTLFKCRYSQSRWLYFWQEYDTPLEVYSHYLKGNKNITHFNFFRMVTDFDVNRFLCDLPWVTSISPAQSMTIPAVPRDLLFIRSSNDLNTFAKEIKLDSSSTYIFSDTFSYSDELRGDGRVLISFVAPTSGKRLILRLKHSGGEEDPPLEVTLGSNNIHLNPLSKSSLTIDEITLYPIEVSNSSDHLSFVPEVRNDIFIQFIATGGWHDHYLHNIELLDENGLEYMPHSASLSVTV